MPIDFERDDRYTLLVRTVEASQSVVDKYVVSGFSRTVTVRLKRHYVRL